MRFGRPFARRKTGWVTSIFNETAIDSTATVVTELVLLGQSEWDPLSGAQNFPQTVRRMIGNLVVTVTPSVSSSAFDQLAATWAIYQLDADDTDSTLNSVASGTIMSAERILQTGAIGFTVKGNATSPSIVDIWQGLPINFDLRSVVRVRNDELLLFGIQLVSGAGTALSTLAISGITRVLVDRP